MNSGNREAKSVPAASPARKPSSILVSRTPAAEKSRTGTNGNVSIIKRKTASGMIPPEITKSRVERLKLILAARIMMILYKKICRGPPPAGRMSLLERMERLNKTNGTIRSAVIGRVIPPGDKRIYIME